MGCSAPLAPGAVQEQVPTAPRALNASSERVAEAAQVVASAGLDLEAFEPLLAMPALGPAAEALERGDGRAAAHTVQAWVRANKPAGVDSLRWHLLLGRLFESAADYGAAAGAYRVAASQPWILAHYARLGQARALSGGGTPRAALELLPAEPPKGPVGLATLLVRATAARKAGEIPLAVDAWRRALSLGVPGAELPEVSLALASALLECEPPLTARNVDASAERSGTCSSANVAEALTAVRRIIVLQEGSDAQLARAIELEQLALSLLSPSDEVRLAPLSAAQRLVLLRALVERRSFERADLLAQELLGADDDPDASGPLACEARMLRAKALAGGRHWGRARDLLVSALARCAVDTDLRARMLYLAGKYGDADGRKMEAIRHFEQLEREAPEHRLADDARLLGAKMWLDRGVEARFTEMLTHMPEDYPQGDMMLDGVFFLALRRMDKGDWSGAASVLERASAIVERTDVLRGQEFSGRERYFLARARIELGQKEQGLSDLVDLVRELPLSYYMLQAYSRLVRDDPHHARTVLNEALDRATEAPFAFEHRPEFDLPEFRRAMELLRVGETEWARREIEAAKLSEGSRAPSVLWGVALLYERAGVAGLAHRLARGLLTDWLSQWPAGDWMRAWQIAFPRPYLNIVQREAERHQVPEYLAYGVMREESAFQPAVVSHANAYGLMQIIVPTARAYAAPLGLPWSGTALKQPTVNIALGCRILGDLSTQFAANPLLAIPGYNAGPGRPRRWRRERPDADFDIWVELIPFRETHRYTKRVLASRATYAFLYHPESAHDAMVLPVKVGG